MPQMREGQPKEEEVKSEEYVCGKCGESFMSDEDRDNVQCFYCDAILCEHCGFWTGGAIS